MSIASGGASANVPGLAYTGPVTWYSGKGVPNAALGASGDMYVRTDGAAGSCIYQKRGSAWVATNA